MVKKALYKYVHLYLFIYLFMFIYLDYYSLIVFMCLYCVALSTKLVEDSFKPCVCENQNAFGYSKFFTMLLPLL